ncbi:hypothetical protein ABZ468_09550 [Streptomyces sp. NPDC005708]|uniref:hypothetical protein n=1 Tax=unclassified Streptomyces TaxID=2593676 RepID=UPI0033C08719
MKLIVGILIVVLGLPLLGAVATKVMNGPMENIGRFLWILGSPALLIIGGWLIYRGL